MSVDLVRLAPGVVARLNELGANADHARTVAGVGEAADITTDAFFAFWAALASFSPPDICLRLARATTPQDYDLASLAALCSPNVRTALEKLGRYKRLCGPKDLVLEPRGHEVAVHTVWEHATSPVPPRLVDGSLASLLVLLQRGTGTTLTPRRVELRRARTSADEALLTHFYGCSIQFRADNDALIFDEATLALPFVTQNDDLVAALLPRLDERLLPLQEPLVVQKVRAAVAKRMSGERPSIEKIAKELAQSPRTLQRRLGEAGTTYQRVLDEVRHQTARRLLRSSALELGEIAFVLGFEELNSFTRAFRSWERKTPLAYRNAAPTIGAIGSPLGAIG